MSRHADTELGGRTSFDAPAEAEWHRMIAEAAYFRAQSRNFAADYALDDWLLAEQDVRRIIQKVPEIEGSPRAASL
jgi:hypothetical protein